MREEKDVRVQKRINPKPWVASRDLPIPTRLSGGLFAVIGTVSAVLGGNFVLQGEVAGGLFFLIGCAFALAGVYWATGGVPLWEWLPALRYNRAWRHQQVTAQAEIHELDAQENEDSYGKVHYTYWVTFRFASIEGPVMLKARVARQQYEQLQEADTMMVRYALDNPCVALIEGEWVDQPVGEGG